MRLDEAMRAERNRDDGRGERESHAHGRPFFIDCPAADNIRRQPRDSGANSDPGSSRAPLPPRATWLSRQRLQLDLIDELQHHVRLRGERVAAEAAQLRGRATQRFQLRLTEIAAIHAVREVANALADCCGLARERTVAVLEAAERDARAIRTPRGESASRRWPALHFGESARRRTLTFRPSVTALSVLTFTGPLSFSPCCPSGPAGLLDLADLRDLVGLRVACWSSRLPPDLAHYFALRASQRATQLGHLREQIVRVTGRVCPCLRSPPEQLLRADRARVFPVRR